jgi:putative copper resistance protein D
MSDPLILVRWLHFSATVLAAGTILFAVACARPALRASVADTAVFRRIIIWIVWVSLALAIASGAVWLIWLASDIYGVSLLKVCVHGGAWTVLTETRFGLVFIARLVLAAALAILIGLPQFGVLQVVTAAGLIGLLALVGHAGAALGETGNIQLGSDIIHLFAAGTWLGALPALALLLHGARNTADDALRSAAVAATRRFSMIAMGAVSALLASGIANSWFLLSSPRDLVSTAYGQLILLKIGLFVAMVGIAAVNWFRLTPRLALPPIMRLLERNALIETGLGLVVLLFVGALGTLSPSGHVHHITANVPADAAFVHIHTNIAMAEVTIEAGRTGKTNAHIRVLREDFSEYPTRSVGLTLDPPTAGNKIVRTAAYLPDGTWKVTTSICRSREYGPFVRSFRPQTERQSPRCSNCD